MINAKKGILDMTSGPVLPLLFRFCIPILLGNLMQQFYNMVDAAIVGQFVGTGALAAVGSTGSILFMVIGFVDGMCAGFCIPLSQAFGAGDEKGMRRNAVHGVYLAICCALLLTTMTSLILDRLLTMIRTPADIYRDAHNYLRILFLGIPATIFYNLTAGILRALGNSRTPLLFLIMASCTNILCDLLFVLGLDLGVAGAGLATVISQLLAAAGCGIYIIRQYPVLHPRREDLRPRGSIFIRLLFSGLPMALQYSITAIGSILIQSSINALGSAYVASVTAALKVQNFAALPFTTLGATMTTWCGQNMGAKNLSRIHAGIRCGMWMGLIYSIFTGVLMYFGGEYITLIFLDHDDPMLTMMMATAREYLRINSLFYFFLSTLSVFRFALQGLEYGLTAMCAGISEMAARSIMALVFADRIGFAAICYASPAAWVAACLLLVPAYLIIMPRIRVRLGTDGK